MNKINHIRSTAVPFPIENVDTDQIIPARFLKATTKDGFGENLFRDWRYTSDGHIIEDFVLNNSFYSGSIFIAGRNFGCGSSREHAAWALKDYGFNIVVSSFFADIFKANALNNGLLPIQISESQLDIIFSSIEHNARQLFEVDLPLQTFGIVGSQHKFDFDISPYKKMCLLEGYDDVHFLLSKQEVIRAFEETHQVY